MKQYDKYTFFSKGPFSQWSPSEFTIDGKTFNCAEQYMMYKKALTFKDVDIATQIMATTSPKNQKDLGRQVKNFVPEIWDQISRDVVFRGNIAKFTQSDHHLVALSETKGTLLVEASPWDKLWGIGLNEQDAANTLQENWPGLNWLGQIITEVREVLEFSQKLNDILFS